jgi:hypothetical protein
MLIRGTARHLHPSLFFGPPRIHHLVDDTLSALQISAYRVIIRSQDSR